MAEAKKTHGGTYVLELSASEAEFLYSLLYWNIAGPPSGPRGYSDRIIYELQALEDERFPLYRVKQLDTDVSDIVISGWLPEKED